MEELAVGPHLIGLRVDIDSRHRIIQFEICLSQVSAVPDRGSRTTQTRQILSIESGRGHEVEAQGIRRQAIAAEHRSIDNRLWSGNGRVTVTHHGAGDESSLNDNLRFDTKEGRLPEN